MGGGGNLKKYLNLLHSDLGNTPYFYATLCIALLFVVHFTYKSARSKILTFVIALVFVVLGVCLSYGAYLTLQKPLFAPRAFIGIGGFVALLCIASISDRADSSLVARLLRISPKILIGFIAYALIVFATAYGNAIAKQQEYTYFRTDYLLRDLESVIPKDQKAALELQGSIGYAKATKPFVDNYQNIARRLIPGMMLHSPYWFHTYPSLLTHRKAPYGNFAAPECKNKPSESTLLLSNHYQDIHKAGSCYIVTLKDPKP